MREESPKSKIETANLLLTLGLKDAAVEQLYMAADLYEKRGEEEEALKIYSRILEIKPTEEFAKKRRNELRKEAVVEEKEKPKEAPEEVKLIEKRVPKPPPKEKAKEPNIGELYKFLKKYDDSKEKRISVIKFLSDLGMYDIAEKEARSFIISYPEEIEFTRKFFESQGKKFLKVLEEILEEGYPPEMVQPIFTYLENIYQEQGMEEKLKELRSKKERSMKGPIQFI